MNLAPGGKRAGLVALACATALVAVLAPTSPVGLGAVAGLAVLTLVWLGYLVMEDDVPLRLATYAVVAFMLGLAAFLMVGL